MAITEVIPTFTTPVPSRSQSPDDFADSADLMVSEFNDVIASQNTLSGQINAESTAINGYSTAAAASATAAANSATSAASSAATAISSPGTIATSASSIAIGLGAKSLTLDQTGKSFGIGQFVTIADTTAPTTKFMHGAITSFNSGTGAMTVSVINYTGTSTGTNWAISISAPPNLIGARLIPEVISATTKTMAIGGDYTFTNTAAQTTATFPPAPNPGDEVTIDNRPTNRLDLTLARNGSNIMGLAEDHTLTDLAAFTFRYIDATQGWRYR